MRPLLFFSPWFDCPGCADERASDLPELLPDDFTEEPEASDLPDGLLTLWPVEDLSVDFDERLLTAGDADWLLLSVPAEVLLAP